MKESARPTCLDEYLKWDKIEKDATKKKDALKEQVIRELGLARFNDIERRQQTRITINKELAAKWAEKNLSKAENDKLYVEAFDDNAFINTLKLKKILVKDLPAGTIVRNRSWAIYPLKPKK